MRKKLLNNKKCMLMNVIVLLVFMVLCSVFGAFGSNVYADGDSGGGGSGSGAFDGVACKESTVSSQQVCDDGTGGSSWHIFKTGNGSYGNGLYYDPVGPTYCLLNITTKGCNKGGLHNQYPNTLSGSGYDWELAQTCPKSEYDYYIAFVRDGWNGLSSKGKKQNVPTYWGPRAFQGGLNNKYYNRNDLKTYADLQQGYIDGTNMHAWRIDFVAARKICAEATKGPCGSYSDPSTEIPNSLGVGYICVKSIEYNITLTAYARDINGNALNNGNMIDRKTATVANGRTTALTVGAMSFPGYRFVGWRDTGAASGGYSSTSNSYTKTIGRDTSVYAFYVKTKNVTLTAYAKTEDGQDLNGARPISSNTITIDKGGSGTATVKNASIADYTFVGWKNNATDASYAGTGASFSKVISANASVFAIYRRNTTNVTLTAYAKDTSGNDLNSNNAISSQTITIKVGGSGSATVSNKSINGYTFKGWKNTLADSTYASTSASYTKTISANTNAFAVYEKTMKNVTLTAYARDAETGKAINDGKAISSHTIEIWELGNGNATVKAIDINGYKPVPCWRDTESTTSKCVSNKNDYTKSINNNTSVYLYYEKVYKDVTLTAYARDTQGNPLLKGAAMDSQTISIWTLGSGSASVTAKSIPGYTFKGWGNTSTKPSTYNPTSAKNTKTINTNTSVYAFYEKNMKKVTLTAYARDAETGKAINDGKAISSHTITIWELGNGNATVKAIDINGYKPVPCWRDTESTTGTCASSKNEYTKSINNNTSVYLYYEKVYKDVTLTAYARDTQGNKLNGGKEIGHHTIKIWVLGSGDATVSKIDFDGYTFNGWRETESTSGSYAATTKDYKKNISSNTSVYAYYERNIFEGQLKVSGATSATVGYSRTNKEQYAFVDNCSPVSGCNVTFEHNLQRVSGSGSTNYRIERTSNLTDTSKGISNATLVGKTAWNGKKNNSGETVKTDGSLTLYPGMVVCETLYFGTYNDKSAGEVSTKVCASALGNAQPPDDPNPDSLEDPSSLSGDTSFINIKVRNQKVAKYSEYQRFIYAKPGDLLDYRPVYNPKLQYTYYLKPQYMSIDAGSAINGKGTQMGTLFNSNRGTLGRWNNGFGLQFYLNNKEQIKKVGSGNGNKGVGNYVYSVGAIAAKTNTNTVKVSDTHCGKKLVEEATTSLDEDTQTTPSQVKFTKYANKYNLGTVVTAKKSKNAYAYVPYNFIITTEIETPENKPDGSPTTVNTGENTSVDISITVGDKQNKETTDNPSTEAYATRADDVQYKLVVYNPNAAGGSKGGGTMSGGKNADICSGYFGLGNDETNCGYSEVKNETSLNPGTTKRNGIGFAVQDQPAGSKVCVAVAVFPASSGADTNWNDKNYDSKWRISNSKCYAVAKKPNMQVVGGNIYSGGQISASLSVKNHLLGYSAYSVKPTNKPYVFGSWGELGLISGGMVSGFASGATLGYLRNTDGKLWPDPVYNDGTTIMQDRPGGSRESNFCKLSVLTFSNKCQGSTAQGIGGKSATSGINGDKSSIQTFINGFKDKDGAVEVSGSVDIANDGTRYYHSAGELTIGDVSGLSNNVIKVIDADDRIKISKNIMYTADTGYANLQSVPKLIIHTTKDIVIDCGVSRIDAVLMARNVKTCDSDNINSRRNSNQLIINGAVVANSLTPNRTYGAAQGVNSMVPAEIINFDPSLYLWGGNNTNNSGNNDNLDDLETTYVRELAPRY